MPTPRDFVKHDLTQCEHGQLARQCLLCEQAAEIERLWAALKGVTLQRDAPFKAEPMYHQDDEIKRLTQRNDELRTANGFADLEAEIERLRAGTKTLREAVVSAAHTLEQARIWDGMKWHWNINATACQRAWKILDAALAAKGE